jgi:hypothetical protein
MLSWRGLILGDGNFWGSGLQPLLAQAGRPRPLEARFSGLPEPHLV